jgi:CheY-like chemotaxis protein
MPQGPARVPRILVADDEADQRFLLHRALRHAGNDVVMASDGGELLDKIAEDGVFDAIITDINMPWMQGLQVLASARGAGLTTPVLVVTGLKRPDLEIEVARMGHAHLLHKPYSAEELRRAVAKLLVSEKQA